MADSPGMDAIAAMAAKKRNAGGTVANALQKSAPPSPGSASNSGRSGAIARRFAKGSPKSGPGGNAENGNIGTNQESGY